jgi:hypothetical protein
VDCDSLGRMLTEIEKRLRGLLRQEPAGIDP